MSKRQKKRKEDRFKKRGGVEELSRDQVLEMLRPGVEAGDADAMFGMTVTYLQDEGCT